MELDLAEANRVMEDEGLTGREVYNEDLTIEYLANHYYLPTVYSKGRRVDYIRHIIDTDSEVRFLGALREYVKKTDCVLRNLDWWMFSKLDQYLDDPFIPYYDPKQNRMARFIPDFIFWGQSGQDLRHSLRGPQGHGTDRLGAKSGRLSPPIRKRPWRCQGLRLRETDSIRSPLSVHPRPQRVPGRRIQALLVRQRLRPVQHRVPVCSRTQGTQTGP